MAWVTGDSGRRPMTEPCSEPSGQPDRGCAGPGGAAGLREAAGREEPPTQPAAEPDGRPDAEPSAQAAAEPDAEPEGGSALGRARVRNVGRARPASRPVRGSAPRPNVSTRFMQRPQ